MLFRFHHFTLDTQVFSSTPHSFAFVQVKPLRPGHVIVAPTRRVPKLSQLSDHEVVQLFIMVKQVTIAIERVYNVAGTTVVLQNGVAAGQSFPHVHLHVITMTGGDGLAKAFGRLDGDGGSYATHLWERVKLGSRRFAERGLRSDEEMDVEAQMLRREMQVGMGG